VIENWRVTSPPSRAFSVAQSPRAQSFSSSELMDFGIT